MGNIIPAKHQHVGFVSMLADLAQSTAVPKYDLTEQLS